MASATYKKGPDAPEDFHPEVDPGGKFEADYDHDQEKALVAAGWVEPAATKKEEK